VIGESSYESAAVAADIARFQRDTGRPIAEVYEWWSTREGGACASAPYRADAYITALGGAAIPPPTPSPLPLLPVPTLTATVTRSGRVALKDPHGRTVTALDAGAYRIIARDHSTTAGFLLIAGRLKLATGKAYTPARAIRSGAIGSDAPYGATARYGSTARTQPLVAFPVD
jgi:hypothetical protein